MTNLFIKYLLQINESTAEDRYRKKLGLQPLEELSEYEKLERYSKDDSIMISFRDEYYSKTKRIGLSLKSYKGTDKTTPNGIYCYPLKKLWPDFDHKDKAVRIVSTPETSFFIPSKPHAIAVLKLNYNNCLDFRSYNKTEFDKDIEKLYNKYCDKTKTIIDFKDEIENIEEDNFIRKPVGSKNNVYYSNMIWLAFFYVYKKIKKSNNVNIFTKIIKEAGYDSVYDDYGIIHIGITTQIVIFKQEAYELIEVIDVNKINKKSNDFDNLYMPTKTKNEKIYKLIIEALGKDYEKNINKIKSLLKNLDDINYSPKREEPLIYYFINDNKPEMVRELANYPEFNPNIKFKDYYINPIMFAVYKNNTEIVETLLSTNKLKNFKDIKNVFGKTVLDIANDNKNKKIIKLLTQY